MPKKKEKLILDKVSPLSPRRSQRLAAKKVESHLNQSDKENSKPQSKQSKNSLHIRNRSKVSLSRSKTRHKNSSESIKGSCQSNTEKLNNVKNKPKTKLKKDDIVTSPILLEENLSRKMLLKNDSLKSKKEPFLRNNCKKQNIKKRGTNSEMHSSVKTKHNRYLRKSDSFEEYGLFLPSYETILDNKARMEVEAKALDTCEELYGDLNITLPKELKDLVNGNTNEQQNLELLDCKFLSTDELKKYFCDNLEYIRNIWEGKIYSKRHKKFMSCDATFDFTYSTSTVIYTEEQKDYLLMLLEENFDPEEKYTQYFFKVLLPEACLKIFMDVHNKTFEEAENYLEWRPVE